MFFECGGETARKCRSDFCAGVRSVFVVRKLLLLWIQRLFTGMRSQLRDSLLCDGVRALCSFCVESALIFSCRPFRRELLRLLIAACGGCGKDDSLCSHFRENRAGSFALESDLVDVLVHLFGCIWLVSANAAHKGCVIKLDLCCSVSSVRRRTICLSQGSSLANTTGSYSECFTDIEVFLWYLWLETTSRYQGEQGQKLAGWLRGGALPASVHAESHVH